MLFIIIWQISHLIAWLKISADAHTTHGHRHYAKLSLINNSASFGQSFFNYGDEWKSSIWSNDNYLRLCCKLIILSCCPGLISSGCITPLLPISSEPCVLWMFLNGTPTVTRQTLIYASIHTVIMPVRLMGLGVWTTHIIITHTVAAKSYSKHKRILRCQRDPQSMWWDHILS